MSKHTPGPWSYEQTHASINIWSANKEIAGLVDDVNLPHLLPEAIANAHLIAAAPELLEALKAMRAAIWSENIDTQNAAHERAEAAIAKATSSGGAAE